MDLQSPSVGNRRPRFGSLVGCRSPYEYFRGYIRSIAHAILLPRPSWYSMTARQFKRPVSKILGKICGMQSSRTKSPKVVLSTFEWRNDGCVSRHGVRGGCSTALCYLDDIGPTFEQRDPRSIKLTVSTEWTCSLQRVLSSHRASTGLTSTWCQEAARPRL